MWHIFSHPLLILTLRTSNGRISCCSNRHTDKLYYCYCHYYYYYYYHYHYYYMCCEKKTLIG